VPHDHAHGGSAPHTHGVAADADTRMLTLALALNVGYMLVEVATGIIAGSLALLSDAAHMLTDAGAIALALVAARLAMRRAGGSMTFGYKRAEILSAQVNGVTLVLLALFIVYEAIGRLTDPPDVDAPLVLVVALVGAVVNLGAALALARANRESLNVEGAFQHNLMDLFASLATAAAAVVIMLTGADRADAIASLLIAIPMLWTGGRLIKTSARIFLEAAPAGVDPDAIGRALVAVPGVREVHDLHVWEVTSGFPALSAHVLVAATSDCHAARRTLEHIVHDEFGIEHSTLQVEADGEQPVCTLLACGR